MEEPATRHDDAALVDPGVRPEDCGVSPASLPREALVGVVAGAGRSSGAAFVGAEENDDIDGSGSSRGGVSSEEGDCQSGFG